MLDVFKLIRNTKENNLLPQQLTERIYVWEKKSFFVCFLKTLRELCRAQQMINQNQLLKLFFS